MHLFGLARRDPEFLYSPSRRNIEGKSDQCMDRICSNDIVYCICIIAFIFVICLIIRWCRARDDDDDDDDVDSEATRKRKHVRRRNRRRRHYRLHLPYPAHPSEPAPPYKPEFEYENKGDADISNESTLIDPYHIVNHLDNSLITKSDAHFNGTTLPQPVLDQKKTGKLQGLGLGIKMELCESPFPGLSESVAEEEKLKPLFLTPPPPPAYLRNARSDT